MQLLFVNFSDLTFLLAISAILLLITAELALSHYWITNLTIDEKKLKNVALGTGILFSIVLFIRIANIITTL
jgi:hypothetical protein